MVVIKGGREQLERDLVYEIFRPAENRERIAELMRQMAPRGELQLQTQIDLVRQALGFSVH